MFSKYFKTLSLQVALEKLKLEQDVTAAEGDNQKKKKDVARLLKNALGVEIKEKLIGRVLSHTGHIAPYFRGQLNLTTNYLFLCHALKFFLIIRVTCSLCF